MCLSIEHLLSKDGGFVFDGVPPVGISFKQYLEMMTMVDCSDESGAVKVIYRCEGFAPDDIEKLNKHGKEVHGNQTCYCMDCITPYNQFIEESILEQFKNNGTKIKKCPSVVGRGRYAVYKGKILT